jgi:peptide-methionine (S)-S-oxide reductase
LSGGCFWCPGVLSVESGYIGGEGPNPNYKQVCRGNTGHIEVVQIRLDRAAPSFRELPEFFFAICDPTTLNRQSNHAGTQYRSAIFYESPKQKKAA